ncbi:MAG: TetR/AcrR family transcriptional regulator [Acidimicrobiia bacterium]
MGSNRRIGAEDSATRTALLDAARELMLEEGYAAVTSRRVAAKAGLKPQLVHYYFRTMDDLFVALVRRGAEQSLERQARALASDRPLHALWEISTDRAGAMLTMELSALGNHRKVIRAELARYAEQFRRLQHEALEPVLAGYGLDADALPTDALLMVATAVSQILAMEHVLGMTTGHAEVRELVGGLLDRYERTGKHGRTLTRGPRSPRRRSG